MLRQNKLRVGVKALLFAPVLGLALFVAVVVPAWSPVAHAVNTSSTLNFQARLLTSSGAVVPDGFYNIRFKIYDGGTQGASSGTGQANSGTGGTYLWTESYYDSNGVTAGNDNRLQVINGYFSVNLGSQTAFSGINWDQELWMTMDIGGSTQTATPTYDGEMTNSNARIKLTGVPYAFSAGQLAASSGAHRGTLGFGSVTNDPVITLPNASGTVCLQSASACGFVLGTGTAFLQGGNSFGATGTLGTTDSNGLNLITNSHIVLGLSSTGAATFENFSNSTMAFQVQDSSASALFNVNSTDGFTIDNGITAAGNVIENPSFESNGTTAATGWYTPSASQVITNDPSNANGGNNELVITGNSSTHAVTTKYIAVHPGDTIYTEAYVKNSGGANGNAGIYLEFSDKDKANATFSNNDTGLPGTSYIAKTITTTVPSGKYFVRMAASVKASSTTGTFYFDDFYLKKVNEQAPLLITNVSTTAFQVQNASSQTVLGVDSSTSSIFTTIPDSGSAIGFTLNTPSYTTSGAKLLSLQNNGTPKFVVDKDGNVSITGDVTAGGNMSIGSGKTYQINGTQITSAALSNDSNLAKLTGTGPQIFSGNNKFTGTVLAANTNSAGFQVQNASTNVFTVDTSGNKTILGTGGGSGLTGNLQFNYNGSSGSISLVALDPSSTAYTLSLPAETGTLCTSAASSTANCTNFASASSVTSGLAGKLNKNAMDTSAVGVTVGNNLYAFTNNSSAVASGVLKLDNNNNTDNVLYVTGSTDYASGKAYIVVNNTNGTPSGSLIDLQANASSVFSVDATGAVAASGNISIASGKVYQINGIQISSAALSNDSNLAKLGANQTFSGNNTFSSGSNSFTGNGANLTSLDAGNVSSGTLSNSRLNATVALTDRPGQIFTGDNAFSPTGNNVGTIINQTSGTATSGSVLDVQAVGGAHFLQITNAASGEGNVTLQSVGATRDLTLNSASGILKLGSATTSLQKSASSFTIDIATAGTSTLTIGNSNGSNTADLSVTGNIAAGSGKVYKVGATSGTSFSACGAGQYVSGQAVTGGIVNAGSCTAVPADTLQTAYDNSSSPATILTSSSTKGVLLKAGSGNDSTTLFRVQDSAANNYILVNSSGASVSVGDTGIASTVTIGNTTGSVAQTINIGTNASCTAGCNIHIGSSANGSTNIDSLATAINSSNITTNQGTITLFNTNATNVTEYGAGTTIAIGASSGSINLKNANQILGSAAGSGQLTNNGSTLNTTLALTNFNYTGSGNTGSIGSAASTVDIYTSISIAQTTASQTLTVPTPTASTSYGRTLYISNIGTTGFKIGTVTIAPGSGATLVWSNTNGGATWQFAGSDAGSLQNSYNNSTGGTTSEIILDSTRTGLDIQDRSTSNGGTAGANLLNVRATAANDTTLGTILFSVGNTGQALFQNSSDSATAFQVQNAGGTNMLSADTLNSQLGLVRSVFSGNLLASRAATISSTGTVTTAVDTAAGTGAYTTSAIGADGLPVIAYYVVADKTSASDADGSSLKVAHCSVRDCSSSTTTTVDTTLGTFDSSASAGTITLVDVQISMKIGIDGLPIISYYNCAAVSGVCSNTSGTSDRLKVVHCTNITCSTHDTVVTPDAGSRDTGLFSSLAIGNDGFPFIAYYDNTGNDLRITHCTNVGCTANSGSTLVQSTNDVGNMMSIVIGTDGQPVISHWLSNSTGGMYIIRCTSTDFTCSSSTSNLAFSAGASNTADGKYTSITIGSDGLPVYSTSNGATSDLVVGRCTTTACTAFTNNYVGGGTTFTGNAPSQTNAPGFYSSIAIAADGMPVIASYDSTGLDPSYFHCTKIDCTTYTAQDTPETTNDVGKFMSMTLGPDGLPIMAYYNNTSGGLRVSRCQSITRCTTTAGNNANTLGGGITLGSAGVGIQNAYINNVYTTDAINPFNVNVNNATRISVSPNGTTSFTGAALFKSFAGGDSATAFQVQNSSARTLLNVDTTGSEVTIGNTTDGAQITLGATGNATSAILKTMVVNGTIAANDLVQIDTANAGQVKQAVASSTNIFGVASSAVGSGSAQDIVISGVYQVNANSSGGTIAVGDTLVSSSTAGQATKSGTTTSSGSVVGLAMSAISGGKVWVYINLGLGGSDNLQTVYNKSTGSTTPEIKVDSTRGGVDIQDADSTISGSLLTVRQSNGSGLGTAILDVQSNGTISTGQTSLALFNTTATTATALQAATSITLGATSGTLTMRNANITIGNAAGSGVFTNNGATLNSTLALGDLAAGSMGSAATTVDIYTSFSIAPTASGRAYTIATPTASTSYGRAIYISNIASGANYFTISGIRIPPGSTGTLIWSNTSGGATWQFAGAGGASIENQNSADQTATFRIAGSGTLNVLSTTAFQVQNGSGAALFTVDTTNGIIQIGSSASNTGTSILALNSNDGTTTPTEVDGGMYYNNSTGQFLCGENGFWVSCGVPPRDHSYDMYDEFMNGMGNDGIPTSVCTSPCAILPTNTVGIGGLNWYNSLIGSGQTTQKYLYNQTGGNAPAADANRPGLIDIQQTGTGNNSGQTMSLGVASMKLGTSRIDLKTAVNITGGNLTVLVGMHNETTAVTAPTTGVYWKEASNGAWNYCYVNATPTETCASSGVTATAGSWYRLEIIMVSSTEVDFYINGTKIAVTGITYNTTNKVAPAYTSYKTSGTPGTLDVYIDYFQLLGTTTSTR